MSESIGKRIRYVREKRGITQKWLAERIGITKQAMYKIEKSNIDLRGSRIAEFAKVLRVSSDYLLGLKEEEISDRIERLAVA
jgi:transcriptional regulator with XRE-family HTH domain